MDTQARALIPTRFLVITAQLISCLSAVMNKEFNLTEESIDGNFRVSMSDKDRYQYLVAFSLSVVFLILELIGFISGATMFMSNHCLICCICTAFFIAHSWTVCSYWYIFAGTVCFPLLCEIWKVCVKIWFKHSL